MQRDIPRPLTVSADVEVYRTWIWALSLEGEPCSPEEVRVTRSLPPPPPPLLLAAWAGPAVRLAGRECAASSPSSLPACLDPGQEPAQAGAPPAAAARAAEVADAGAGAGAGASCWCEGPRDLAVEGWLLAAVVAVRAPSLWLEPVAVAWEAWEAGVLARDGSSRGEAASATGHAEQRQGVGWSLGDAKHAGRTSLSK
jgi:hypothetical protein